MSDERRLSPYKGLTPFEDSELDVRFFFGREQERELIEANLMASRLTVLYGETGVGKSSVLRAGVAHHLRGVAERNLTTRGEPGMAVVVFDAWRDDPLNALRTAVMDAVTEALGASLRPPDDDVPLVEALRMWGTVLDGDIYIVLDQAEEYFLYHPAEDDPKSFAVQFPIVVNAADLRANFLLAIREDALAKLDVFKARIPNVLGNYLRLEHLDPRAARAAIVEPIRAYNGLVGDDETVEIEHELVDVVLEQVVAGKVDVRQSGRGAVTTGEATVRIETAYLQLVMYRLWEAERSVGSRVLRLETLRRLGDAEQIVRDHVDEALTGLTGEEKDLVARMLDHLVTPSGAKIAHEVVDLADYAGAPEAAVLPVLAKLGDERILRSVSGNGGRRAGYEIYHDVLAQPVLAWKAGHEIQREREREAAEAERRHRRLVRLLAAAGVALLVMAAVTAFAVGEWNKARSQARLAHGRELAGAALLEMGADPLQSLELALVSARLTRSPQAETVLRQALFMNRERAILPSDGAVHTVAYSRNGLLVTASTDGKARLWRADGTLAHVLPHGGPVTAAAFSPDGSLVLTASRDHTARIWRTSTGERVETLRHRAPVTDASFSDDGSRIVTASADGTVRVWSVRNGGLDRLVRVGGWPASAAFSHDGRLILVTGPERAGGAARARLYDAASGRFVRRIPAVGVTVASFSPDGTMLVTGLKDGDTVLWRVRDGVLLHTLRGKKGGPPITDVAFSRRGGLLAASNADGVTHVWLIPSGSPWVHVLGHVNKVTHVGFSDDGKLLLTAGIDGTARIWMVRDGGRIEVLRGPRSSAVVDAAFSPDENSVATAGLDGAARLWDAVDLRPLLRSAKPVLAASFAPDGRRLVEAGDDGAARILTVRGRVLRTLVHHAPVRGAIFTPDGRLVLTDDANGVLRVWNASTGLLVRSARNVSSGPLALSHDGRYLTAPTMKGAVGVWRVSTLRRLLLIGRGKPFNAAAFSPDGHLIGAAGEDGVARLLDARTGRVVRLLPGHTRSVTGIAFSNDGRLVVTSSLDHEARIWHVATRQAEALQGHDGAVLAASFSPDGRWVVTAGPASAGVWDVSNGDPVAFLSGHRSQLTAASFSPDGTRILTAGLDGTVRIYTCDICGDFDQLVAAATARLAAISDPLTPAQRARLVPAVNGA